MTEWKTVGVKQEREGNVPANGRLAVGRTLGRSESLPNLRLREPQGQPADLEILGKLANFLQINSLLRADCLLGFCKSGESG